jgi:hypothetical protein
MHSVYEIINHKHSVNPTDYGLKYSLKYTGDWQVAGSKQTTHRVHVERFNLKKLNEVEGKEQYRVEISNRFAALENFDAEVDINRTSETITENIKISAKPSLGYHELRKHTPWFDEGYSELLDRSKQAIQQCLQDPSEINGG